MPNPTPADHPADQPAPFRYIDEDGFCLSAHLLPDLNTGGTTGIVSITIEGSDEPQSAHVPVAELPKILAGIAGSADPAVWVDGDPLMEAMAAAVYEQCDKHPEVSVTIDDPRTIAAVAATVARQLLGTTVCPECGTSGACNGGPCPLTAAEPGCAMPGFVGCDCDHVTGCQHPPQPAPCPTPETHNWGCGCPTDQAPAAKRVEAEHVLYDALTKGTPLAQVRQHIIDAYRAAVIAEHTHAAPPAPADRAALTETEQTMLNYALNQAQLRIWSGHGSHTEEDQAALVSLRRLAAAAAAGVQPPTTSEANARTMLCSVANLGRIHHAHTWQAQPSMPPLLCPGRPDWSLTPPAAPAAPEEPTPAPQCSAALLPATDEAVDRCVRHGAHDTHTTAAGVRWPNDEDPEL